jgi:hypothetical protein
MKRQKTNHSNSFAIPTGAATAPGTATTATTTQHPANFALHIFAENGHDGRQCTQADSIPFVRPTEARIAAYKTSTVMAARTQSVADLRTMLQAGVSFDCCNSFGESLISMLCRIGKVDVVRFLVNEAKVSLLIRDDFGRTVFHDAFWSPEPRIELVDFLLRQVPDLLCVVDVRGHAPLRYSRRDQWDQWNAFLNARRFLLHPKLSTQSSNSDDAAAIATTTASAPPT